ncbi:MAG: DUF5397 domain-containing protein [Prosthecobacter sp.]|uniref:DUF5397 family protein n=1 Tax=Prosthecobacter sp. TaxID=1965333 RepID=UPI0025DE3D7E|nr:DUF5397 family protein [Prosthecobacter sp.]MCF7785439.1 DUF5397 domain-containing protein [Prosthecobacter sp.]
MRTPPPPSAPVDLMGSCRSFGEYGPVYQVTGKVSGHKVHVVVMETGEELDYPIEQAAQDPVAL